MSLCYTVRGPTVTAMARITVEDCLDKVSSRFELVMLASMRAKQLLKGAKPLIQSDNRDIVIVGLNERLGAFQELLRPHRREHHELKTTGHFIQTIFNGYSGHGGNCRPSHRITQGHLLIANSSRAL